MPGWLRQAGTSRPIALLKQGQPEQVAQDCVKVGFEYLQGWVVHNFSGWPVPVFDFSRGGGKKSFLVFRCNFMVINFLGLLLN